MGRNVKGFGSVWKIFLVLHVFREIDEKLPRSGLQPAGSPKTACDGSPSAATQSTSLPLRKVAARRVGGGKPAPPKTTCGGSPSAATQSTSLPLREVATRRVGGGKPCSPRFSRKVAFGLAAFPSGKASNQGGMPLHDAERQKPGPLPYGRGPFECLMRIQLCAYSCAARRS